MYKTEQELFWSGEFGDEYIIRNNSKNMLSSNIALFPKFFRGSTMSILLLSLELT